MLSLLEQFLYDYFSNKQPNFAVLKEDEKALVFEVALSYPDLFSYILPHINKNYFYDEENERGNFSYYPHYFLINSNNAKWFVENCPILRDSFFRYCDWFSDDAGNLEARSNTVPNSLQEQHYNLLKEEADNHLSFMEFKQIIENMVQACQKINFVPEEVDGILDVIENRSDSLTEKQELSNLVLSVANSI